MMLGSWIISRRILQKFSRSWCLERKLGLLRSVYLKDDRQVIPSEQMYGSRMLWKMARSRKSGKWSRLFGIWGRVLGAVNKYSDQLERKLWSSLPLGFEEVQFQLESLQFRSSEMITWLEDGSEYWSCEFFVNSRYGGLSMEASLGCYGWRREGYRSSDEELDLFAFLT